MVTYHLLLHHQVVQLLETPFVNLINYASLVTTNAARHRHVAGKSKVLLEFGLRRAQVLYHYPPLFNCHCNTY
jgi:nicotinic acid phosphoribosyltransferase